MDERRSLERSLRDHRNLSASVRWASAPFATKKALDCSDKQPGPFDSAVAGDQACLAAQLRQ